MTLTLSLALTLILTPTLTLTLTRYMVTLPCALFAGVGFFALPAMQALLLRDLHALYPDLNPYS